MHEIKFGSSSFKKKTFLLMGLIAIASAAILVAGLVVGLKVVPQLESQQEPQPTWDSPVAEKLTSEVVGLPTERSSILEVPKSKPTSLPKSASSSCPDPPLQGFDKAAVCVDGTACAQIATDVLRRNGNAADAAIAALFCDGVVNPQSMGLGGGFLLTHYVRQTRTAHTLDAREVAPATATPEMFRGDPNLSAFGGLAIAVPGEVRGYWEYYQKLGGGVRWRDLIEPTIRLCEEGHPVSTTLAKALVNKQKFILAHPTMSVFVNPETGLLYKEGEILHRPQLAKTLRRLQEEPDAYYTGSLSKDFLQDLQDLGSIITKEDLETYRPQWRTPVNVSLENGNLTLYSVPPPGSGLVLSFILNILDNYRFNKSSLDPEYRVTTHQRIVEAMKFAYAKRTELGDQDFVNMTEHIGNLTNESLAKEIAEKITLNFTYQDPGHYGAVFYQAPDGGTAHISVLSPNGDAVSVTSTINLYFGAVLRSNSTGIILNDEMDDFSSPKITNYFGVPPSPANFIQPGKRPLSSMSPAIIIDKAGNVRLVVGAAGGTKISSSTAWVAMNNLWFGQTIKDAIYSKRLHHQLLPMTFQYEYGFPKDIVESLQKTGHEVVEYLEGSSVCGVSREGGRAYGSSDIRKCGDVKGF